MVVVINERDVVGEVEYVAGEDTSHGQFNNASTNFF
jgi:hypothetical protein